MSRSIVHSTTIKEEDRSTGIRLYKISLPESWVKLQHTGYYVGMEFTPDSLILKYMTREGRVLTQISPGKTTTSTAKPNLKIVPPNTEFHGFSNTEVMGMDMSTNYSKGARLMTFLFLVWCIRIMWKYLG